MSVYVITDGKYFKIGYTEGVVETRVASLQTGNANRLILVFQAKGCRALEKKLHADFHAKRISGEWFDLSNSDLQAIREAQAVEKKTATHLTSFLNEMYEFYPRRREASLKNMRGLNISVPVADLRRNYTEWCVRKGEKFPVGPTRIREAMATFGCPQDRDHFGNRAYLGLVLKGAAPQFQQETSAPPTEISNCADTLDEYIRSNCEMHQAPVTTANMHTVRRLFYYTPTAALRAGYIRWCAKNGFNPLAVQRYTATLRAKGLIETVIKVSSADKMSASCGLPPIGDTVRAWIGVKLNSEADTPIDRVDSDAGTE